MAHYILSDGDDWTANTVDLMNVDPSDSGTFILAQSLKAPPADEEKGETTRTVTCDLFFHAPDTTRMLGVRQRIERLLALAPRATGNERGDWTGEPVSFWASLVGGDQFVYFDVLRGRLVEKQRDFGPDPIMIWTLTLVCLPDARGPMQALDWSGELSNASPTYFLTGLPGDRDVLCQLEGLDDSTGGLAVNALRTGVRSLPGMAATDFTFDAPITAVSPGTSTTDVTSLNGATAVHLATDSSWQTVGIARVTGAGLDALLADLRVHFKSDAGVLSPPTGLAIVAVPTGGFLISNNTWAACISSVDGSGNESSASGIVTATIHEGQPNTYELQLSWTPNANAASQWLYLLDDASIGHWFRISIAAGVSSYTFSILPGSPPTTAPPTFSSPDLTPPELRVSVGVNAASPTWSAPGDPITAQIGGSLWEWGYGGTFRVPPVARMEGQADLGYAILVEARSLGTNSPTIAVDSVRIWPREEPQSYALQPTMDSTTPRRWLVDGRRDERPAGILTDFSTTPVLIDAIPVLGLFTLREGENLLLFEFTGAGGTAHSTNLKMRIRPWITPLYKDVVGLG